MNKKMNNKGFSLVELIIVIAIMVVLIAVLAPQYLKYVEKSRVASDQTSVVEYINAMQVLAADPDVSLATDTTYKLTRATVDDKEYVKPDDNLAAVLKSSNILDADTADNGSLLQSSGYQGANINIILKYNSNKVWEVKNDGGDVEVSGKLKTAAGGGAGE